MNVPFLDLQEHNRRIADEIRASLDSVIANSQFILGPAVERFEKRFAEYIGRRFCIGLNSGTSALHMALIACDIGPGDEVITTPHTWISTSWAISYTGATPVYVDIDPVTYNIDPVQVERAITARTKAILPVHLYGQACDLTALNAIAEDCGLLLIEDVAQAHGAVHGGKRAGAVGKAGCFSFYPGKNLGAFGEGGAVVTDDESLARRIRQLRDHAQAGRHHHVEIGYNTRMEGIQGAVLDVKLRHLDDWNAARRRHAERYHELLADAPDLVLPVAIHPEGHVWHLFVVLAPKGCRESMQKQLAERGVATGVHYPTLVPFQPAYAHLGYRAGDLPVARDAASRCLSLPMYAELTAEQLEYVADSVHRVLETLCEPAVAT
jgi:dTDP-4-amino-4,6-dideoxygalactose transaminase